MFSSPPYSYSEEFQRLHVAVQSRKPGHREVTYNLPPAGQPCYMYRVYVWLWHMQQAGGMLAYAENGLLYSTHPTDLRMGHGATHDDSM